MPPADISRHQVLSFTKKRPGSYHEPGRFFVRA